MLTFQEIRLGIRIDGEVGLMAVRKLDKATNQYPSYATNKHHEWFIRLKMTFS